MSCLLNMSVSRPHSFTPIRWDTPLTPSSDHGIIGVYLNMWQKLPWAEGYSLKKNIYPLDRVTYTIKMPALSLEFTAEVIEQYRRPDNGVAMCAIHNGKKPRSREAHTVFLAFHKLTENGPMRVTASFT